MTKENFLDTLSSTSASPSAQRSLLKAGSRSKTQPRESDARRQHKPAPVNSGAACGCLSSVLCLLKSLFNFQMKNLDHKRWRRTGECEHHFRKSLSLLFIMAKYTSILLIINGYNSVTLSTFTVLCNHQHCLVSELCHHLKEKPHTH